MTAVALTAQPDQETGVRPVPWRRMVWVTWRQQRAALISVPAVFGAVAVFLWVAGLKFHRDAAALAACHPSTSAACESMFNSFNGGDWTAAHAVELLLNITPALIGAFAGGPVLARELESGTFRYAWTQGFGRARWTAAKLVLLGAAITAVAGAFSVVFAWFFQPFLAQESLTPLTATVFGTRVVSFAGWTLAAFAIGAFLGALIRRILPAVAVTLGVYLGLITLTWQVLREHYPVTMVTSNPNIGSGAFNVNWPSIVSIWWGGSGGKLASQSVVSQYLSRFYSNPHQKLPLAQFLAQHGLVQWTRYIPVSRFWPMQLFEGGWLLALSALLIAATVWLVRHHAA